MMNRLGYWESIKKKVKAGRDKLVEKWFSTDEEATKEEKKTVSGGGGVFNVCVCVCVSPPPPFLSYFFPRTD